jgi:hypothetical protein
MKGSRLSEEQIVGVLKETEGAGSDARSANFMTGPKTGGRSQSRLTKNQSGMVCILHSNLDFPSRNGRFTIQFVYRDESQSPGQIKGET